MAAPHIELFEDGAVEVAYLVRVFSPLSAVCALFDRWHPAVILVALDPFVDDD